MPCPCPSKKRSLLVLVAAAVGAATAISVMRKRSAKKTAPDLPTVDHVVPERYVGTWYEIARLPNWFQTKCSSNHKAEIGRAHV